MKKSLIALAVLGFAGAASAQSSVTMYGRVDLSIGKPMGTAAKGMFNGSGSRLGMRGVEDLGGGLKGLFNIETRFDADTGAAQNMNVLPTGVTAAAAGAANGVRNRFWGARSIVGLEGGFGRVTLGREYTTAFLQSQLAADPWGWDTVAAGMTAAVTGGGIAPVRNDSALTYTIGFSGIAFGVQVAERTDAIVNVPNRPMNAAFSYGAGPISASLAHDRPGTGAKWTTGHFAYAIGPVKPGIFIGRGTNALGAKVKSEMITATFGLGAGEVRAAVGQLSTGGVKSVKSGAALGYHHNVSKRTTLYADFVRNGALATQKTGYDVGLKHNF